jgi:hypothetical protein
MDSQTAGALLPILLLGAPLVLAILDLVRTGRGESHAAVATTQAWPTPRA